MGPAFVPIRSVPSADGPTQATPAADDVKAIAPFELGLEGATADDSVNLLLVAFVVAALALLGALASLRLARGNPRLGAR